MPSFKFDEATDSPEVSTHPPSRRHRFVAAGWDDADAVLAYALNATPTQGMVDGQIVYRQPLRVLRKGFRLYDVDVTFNEDNTQNGQWTWDFDTTGGTVHITSSLETRNSYGAAGNPSIPDHKGSIGVDGDNIHGVDIIIPALKINVQFSHPKGVVTLAHAKKVANLTGTINSTPMLTFSPGEVLFLGGRGSDGSQSDAQVEYQFAMSHNATGLSFGDIASIAKRGHDYLWIRFEDKEDSGHPVKRPGFAYVERVYEEVDLAGQLGFGT